MIACQICGEPMEYFGNWEVSWCKGDRICLLCFDWGFEILMEPSLKGKYHPWVLKKNVP